MNLPEPEVPGIPVAQAICESTGEAHQVVNQNSELICLNCRRPIETCCEGEAGRIPNES